MILPSWIKVGSTEVDLFEIIDSLNRGKSIDEIANEDTLVSASDISELLMRTSMYLHNHLILDSYLETINKFVPVQQNRLKLEWSANEIHELVNLHLSGAEIENIAQLMRKDMSTVRNKLYNLNLIDKGADNG